MKTAKEKLDEKLGIKDLSEIFDQTDIDAILKDSKIEIDNIDNKIKEKAKEIDEKINAGTELVTVSTSGEMVLPANKIYDLEESLGEISFLANKSRDIITNLYKYITNTDFVDPDIISSTAKMIEASRIVISDYIELYKEKMRMIHSFNMEMQKHKNRIALEELKAELKWKYSTKDQVLDGESEDLVPYIQEQIIDIMSKNKNK